MADTNIEIDFEGVGIFYMVDGHWKVLLPFDDAGCHESMFKYKGQFEANYSPERKLAAPGAKVKIWNNGANTASGQGSGFEDFVDLTAEYSHSNGISLKAGWENHTVEYTIYDAEFSISEKTPVPFMVCDYAQPNSTNVPIKKDADNVGMYSKASISLPEGSMLYIQINNDTPIQLPKADDPPGTFYSIKIHNDCDQGSDADDFDWLYDILIEDSAEPGRKYSLKRVPSGQEANYRKGQTASFPAINRDIDIEDAHGGSSGGRVACNKSYVSIIDNSFPRL